jgi:hypothetical protein
MMRLPSHVGDDDADATLVATLPRTVLTWHLVLSSRRTRTDESFVHLKLPTWETLCQIKTCAMILGSKLLVVRVVHDNRSSWHIVSGPLDAESS